MPRPSSPLPEEIDPSDFIHRITFLVPSSSVGVSGAKVTYAAGSPPATAYASIREVRGTDVLRAGLDVSQIYVEITTWYRASIATAKQHIQDANGAEYVVQAAPKIKGVNQYLRFMCVALAETA